MRTQALPAQYLYNVHLHSLWGGLGTGNKTHLTSLILLGGVADAISARNWRQKQADLYELEASLDYLGNSTLYNENLFKTSCTLLVLSFYCNSPVS